ncbi:MAG: hypothetical protein R3A52_10990 [Polyangiales bacterium]
MTSLSRLVTLTALTAACASEVSSPPRADASPDVDVVSDRPTADLGPALDAVADAGTDVAVDRPAPRDLPPDDVDPTCANGANDRCLSNPPGPCADLSDGVDHVVSFDGFAQDSAPSCTGAQTSMGPDAVLPLTVERTSDVSITAVTGTSDTVVVALYPADGCGDRAREIQCVNGSNSIGGIATFRASALPPGRYAVILATARGVDARVQALITTARPRAAGDLCPGVALTPDGAPVTLDTHGFASFADYGTTCGYFSNGGLGWVDSVFRYTITEPRDVTLEADGTSGEDLYMEVTPVCGSTSQATPGCVSGLPARRTLRNQQPGTYFVTVEYRPDRLPQHVLTMRVTTAPPTPPGPASRCPGIGIGAEGVDSVVDSDLLTLGAPIACLPRQRASGYWTLTAPSGTGDLLVNVSTSATRGDAALQVRRACDGDPGFDCSGPVDRAARSVWSRLTGVAEGTSLIVQGGTNAEGGNLTARWYRVPTPTPVAVEGNLTCATARTIPAEGGVFTGTTADATAVATPYCATTMSGCAGSRGALYRLDLTARRRVVAIQRAQGFDGLLAIQSGMSCPGRTFPPMCTDDWYSTDPQVEAVLEAGTYWVFVGGCGPTQVGPYTLDVAVLPP